MRKQILVHTILHDMIKLDMKTKYVLITVVRPVLLCTFPLQQSESLLGLEWDCARHLRDM